MMKRDRFNIEKHGCPKDKMSVMIKWDMFNNQEHGCDCDDEKGHV